MQQRGDCWACNAERNECEGGTYASHARLRVRKKRKENKKKQKTKRKKMERNGKKKARRGEGKRY